MANHEADRAARALIYRRVAEVLRDAAIDTEVRNTLLDSAAAQHIHREADHYLCLARLVSR